MITLDIDKIGFQNLSNPLITSAIILLIILFVFYWNFSGSIKKNTDTLPKYLTVGIIGYTATTIVLLAAYSAMEKKVSDIYLNDKSSDLVNTVAHTELAPNFTTPQF